MLDSKVTPAASVVLLSIVPLPIHSVNVIVLCKNVVDGHLRCRFGLDIKLRSQILCLHCAYFNNDSTI